MRNILIAALLASVLVHVSAAVGAPRARAAGFGGASEPAGWTLQHNRYRSLVPGQAVSP